MQEKILFYSLAHCRVNIKETGCWVSKCWCVSSDSLSIEFSIWKCSGVKEEVIVLSKVFFDQDEDMHLSVKSIWPSEKFIRACNRPFQWDRIFLSTIFDDPLNWHLEILLCHHVMSCRSLIQGPEWRMALKSKICPCGFSLLECSKICFIKIT